MKTFNNHKTLIIAHRGASNLAHENTLDAFQIAYDLKADGIELDLRQTKDGIIIVNHNPYINNLIIKDHTYQELQKEALKENFCIPTFQEVITKFGGKIFLDIEIKEPGFESNVVNLLLNTTTLNMFMIRSFNKDIIIKVKEINKSINTALILGERHLKYGIFSRIFEIFPKKHIIKTECNVISPHHKLLLFRYIKRMHKLGLPVSVWTVNNEKLIKKLIDKQVDYIITNDPDKAIEIRKNSESKNSTNN